MLDMMERFEQVDEDDPEAFAELMEMMYDSEFLASGEALELYVIEECGFPPESVGR
jgi:hypothetical protein